TNFNLGLGLPGVPFDVTANGGVTVQVGFDYELAFSYNNSDSSFSVDTSKKLQGSGPGAGHEMSLNVSVGLEKSFSATVIVGFLEGQITRPDQPNPNPIPILGVAFNLDGLDPAAPNIDPSLSGSAMFDLDLTGGFIDGSKQTLNTQFPEIKSEFKLDWTFD